MRTDYILALSDPDDFLHLISVGHCKGTELLMSETLRITDYHCLHYVLGGHGYYQDAVSGRRQIGKGDIVISYPGRKHVLNPVPECEIDLYYIAFRGQYAEQMFKKHDEGAEAVFPIVDDLQYPHLYTDIMKLGKTRLPYHIGRATSLLHALIIETLYLKKGKNIRIASDDCVSRFTLFVQQQIGKPELDYKSFLRREKISHEAFRKKFKQRTGFYPHAYWLEQRINSAQSLLLQEMIPIKEIAAGVGFADEYYFSRQFKKRTGFSPTQYRETSRKSLFG